MQRTLRSRLKPTLDPDGPKKFTKLKGLKSKFAPNLADYDPQKTRKSHDIHLSKKQGPHKRASIEYLSKETTPSRIDPRIKQQDHYGGQKFDDI